MVVAILRRIWDFIPDTDVPFACYHFDFQSSAGPVMSVDRKFGLQDRYLLAVHADALDRRLAIAMAVAPTRWSRWSLTAAAVRSLWSSYRTWRGGFRRPPRALLTAIVHMRALSTFCDQAWAPSRSGSVEGGGESDGGRGHRRAVGEDVAARHRRSRAGHSRPQLALRAGEIDIVARDGRTLVFCEVKTRRGGAYGTPFRLSPCGRQRRLAARAGIAGCRCRTSFRRRRRALPRRGPQVSTAGVI
jgi:hypothetical protein